MSLPVPLLLLPGLDGTEILLQPLVAALPAWIRPVVVTYPDEGPTGYADLLPCVAAAVNGLGEFVVLGWSFGGLLALQLAAARPDAVRGTILCSTFARAPRPWLARWRFATVAPVVFSIRALRRIRYWVPGFAPSELRRAKAETWRRVGAVALAARSRAILDIDVRAELAACRTPILYLAARGDEVVPQRNAEEILAGARASEIVAIEGSHMALFTHAREAAHVISRFVRRAVVEPSVLQPIDRAGGVAPAPRAERAV